MQQMLGDFLAQDPLGGQEKQREKKVVCVNCEDVEKSKRSKCPPPLPKQPKRISQFHSFDLHYSYPIFVINKKAISVTNTAFLFLEQTMIKFFIKAPSPSPLLTSALV